MKSIPKPLYVLMVLAMLFGMLGMQPVKPVQAVSPDVRISQAYGAGGNTGATYTHDFIELYNSSNTAINLTGWSVQYASATGTSWAVTALTGSIPANSYYLIQEGQGAGGTTPLPTPDVIGAIAMQGASNFKIALVNSITALSGSCPTGVVDFLGAGTATCSEGSVAPGTTNTTALVRKQSGCQDTDQNGADFEVLTPTPRNTASPTYVCPAADAAPTVTSTIPANSATMVPLSSDISVTFSEPVNAPVAAFTLSCADSASHTFVRTTTDDLTFTLNPDADFAEGETCTVNVVASQVTDLDTMDPPDTMQADYTFSFTAYTADPPPAVLSTIPTSNATGVAVADNLSVTFSESVTLAPGAVAISCAYSGSHAVAVETTDNITHTINPTVDFTQSEKCTVTLESTLITDSAAQQMEADYTWLFTTFYNQDVPVPIAVARAAGPSWVGTIEGNVTLLPGLLAPKSFSIQDSTGGMYVYPASTATLPPMALGDVVRVKGTIKNYNTLLEIDPVASVTWISSGTVPDPLPVATNAVGPTQGKLIVVEGTITFTTPPIPPAPGTNFSFTINDGSGPVTVYVYKLTGIDMRSYTSGQRLRIIGISNAYNTPQIQPRVQADVIDLTPPVVSSTIPSTGASDVSPHKPISATFNKPMDPDSFAGFTLTADSGATIVTGTSSYDSSTRTFTFTPNAALVPNTLYTATFPITVTDIYGVPLAAPYVWSFTTGDLDTIAPTITGRMPIQDATNVSISTTVSVTFSEELAASSLNLDHFVLTDATSAVVPATLSYDPVTFTVTLTPVSKLQYLSTYTMKVTANTADLAGNPLTADNSWNFTTMEEPPMQAYFGDIHNHTSISDGSGTPAQALAAGEAAGFDFMAISDHSYAIDDAEWANTLAAVNAATDADFVALRGFEYTQGAEGHINVWNSERHAVRTNTGCTYCDYTPNLENGTTVQGFYDWLSKATEYDSAGMVMQFNHPGWINFNDWFYHPEISGIARLEEIGNGNGTSYVFSESEFIRSLDYGWKVGATNNADTHSTAWGTNTENRTGTWMTELTKSNLLEALRERRTFASEDKNFSLSMKANGYWMGSEIPNTGSISFKINGMDGDGELATLVQVITNQGVVVDSLAPNSSNFTWEPVITVTPGVHYYYVKVTQTDGDKIVASPVWTMGTEDISITDLTIQPTIPTTHNPSLLSVRVTHRAGATADVSVVLSINGVQLGDPAIVTITPNGDGYAFFSWQPTVVGPVTITAEIQGAPTGDNPDDNEKTLALNVTDELLPLILIDAGHGNVNTTGNEMKPFIDDLSAHNYNVLKNLDALTASDLNPEVVKLLMISAPETAYTPEELTAIADYVAAGGSLWLGGLADYTGKVAWANTVADRENAILAAIETKTGQNVNMRMNDDEVIDGNTNNGYVFGVIFQNFPGAASTGIGVNVESVATWSLNSLRGRTVSEPLTASTPGVQIVMQGDMDLGCTADTWKNPFHTSNTDADSQNDAYLYNPTWSCTASTVPAGAIPLPAAAVTDLEGTPGRIMLYGDSNDPFTIFAYTAGDGKQNELFNLQSIMWLLGEPLTKSTIAEVRTQAVEDVPDKLDQMVWVEGTITAAYGEFFNVLYVQDETGGITVHAPAGDIDATTFTRGTKVRVIGTIGIYNGDTEIEFFEAEMVQVLAPSTGEPVGLPLTTQQATLESNEGWLTTISGVVVAKPGLDTLMVDDGSGPIRVFVDGYNGSFDDIQVNDLVRVTGLVSEDGLGSRIRIRNYKLHTGLPDDVAIIGSDFLTVTNVDLLRSTDPLTLEASATAVPGSLAAGFTLVLDPAVEYYYFDTDVITSNRPLANGSYPFYMTANPGAEFFAYWAGRGVVDGATGWQGLMWQIINGDAPMFFLKVEGENFSLIDGLQGEPNPLRVNGGYYLGDYTFAGNVADAFGLTDEISLDITFVAPLAVTEVELTQSTDLTTWTPVEGTLADSYTMNLDATVEYYYLDAVSVTSNRPLADGSYPFYMTTNPGAGFFAYWADRGVVAGATGWQGLMWQIINGDAPMFYLKVEGTSFTLIDGLQGEPNPLRVNGGYYLGLYGFTGVVVDAFGFGDQLIVSMLFNDIPVAEDQAVTTPEDTAIDITLAATDMEGEALVYAIVDQPAHGSVSLVGNIATYTPALNFVGEDSFTFTANDGIVNSNIATVTITVTPINDDPIAVDDAYDVDEDGVLTVAAPGVMANDIEVDTDNMVVVLLTNVNHGSLVLLGNGSFTYTPDPDFNGTDSFEYRLVTYPGIEDAWTDDAIVTITVNPINDAPVATDQNVTTAEDTAKDITLTGTDIDGDTLTFAIVDQPAHGDVVLAGSVATYTPDADFNGEDSFTFTANDGTVDSEMAVVSITVTPVNDAPVAVADAYTTDEDTVLTVLVADGVLDNDSDVDGDTLTAILVSDVSHGTLALAADGSFVYTSAENYFGDDSFTYKASDGTLESNTVTVTLTITPVNDWVVANDDEYETMAGVTLDVAAPGVLTNDELLDPNETVTLQVLVQPAGGTLTLNADGSFTYVPNAGFFGVDTFEYQLNSTVMLQGAFSDTATVTITVTARQIFLPLILR